MATRTAAGARIRILGALEHMEVSVIEACDLIIEVPRRLRTFAARDEISDVVQAFIEGTLRGAWTYRDIYDRSQRASNNSRLGRPSVDGAQVYQVPSYVTPMPGAIAINGALSAQAAPSPRQ